MIKNGDNVILKFSTLWDGELCRDKRKAYIYPSMERAEQFYHPGYEVLVEYAPVRYGHWEWFEEWSPSTPEHPRECEDCGWRCGRCKSTLSDMVGGYWDNAFEEPRLNYCPNCGSQMRLYH